MGLFAGFLFLMSVLLMLVDNGYMYDSLTFWAALIMSIIYVGGKIE